MNYNKSKIIDVLKKHNIQLTGIASTTPIAKCKPSVLDYQAGVLSTGIYSVAQINSMHSLYTYLQSFGVEHALLLGIPKNGSFEGEITSRKLNNTHPQALTRTKEDFGWNKNGGGFLLIDIDDPEEAQSDNSLDLSTAQKVRDKLIEYDPRLSTTAMLIVPSASKRYDIEKDSWHVYIACNFMNESTVKNYAKTLQYSSWLAGDGYISLSASGSLLIRQLFDMAVFSPERLVLESVFSKDPDVTFNQIEPLIQEGEVLNLNITPKIDKNTAERLIQEARLNVLPQSYQIRQEHKAKKISELCAQGISESEAKLISQKMYDEHIIDANHSITFANTILNDDKKYTAGYIKVFYEEFKGLYCADPYSIEDGTQKAYITDNGDIYSFKHGGYIIKLEASFEAILEYIEKIQISSNTSKTYYINQIQDFCATADFQKRELKIITQKLRNVGLIDKETDVTLVSTKYEHRFGKILSTDINLDLLLQKYYFSTQYDVILKDIDIKHNELTNTVENNFDVACSIISSYCEREGLPKTIVKDHLVPLVQNKYSFNPMVRMCQDALSCYDNKDYISELASCITLKEDNNVYKYEILKHWLIQAVAAWHHGYVKYTNPNAKEKFEHVLVLLGEQGANKTKFIIELLNFKSYREYVKEGVKLVLSDKDSVKQTISSGIVELGELDATFKKSDIAELKAFFSRSFDEMRLPYAQGSSRFKRRTVFAASVNEVFFLSDLTGNRRYWLLDIESIDFQRIENLNMEMVWGQATQLFFQGEKWWFEQDDEEDQIILDELHQLHDSHRQVSPVEEFANDFIDLYSNNQNGTSVKQQLSVTKILKNMGYPSNPTKQALSEFKSILLKAGIAANKAGTYNVDLSMLTHYSLHSSTSNQYNDAS